MNYTLKDSRDDADSEYLSYVQGDCKEAEFIGKEQIHSVTQK